MSMGLLDLLKRLGLVIFLTTLGSALLLSKALITEPLGPTT
jgi:hypothetical protein